VLLIQRAVCTVIASNNALHPRTPSASLKAHHLELQWSDRTEYQLGVGAAGRNSCVAPSSQQLAASSLGQRLHAQGVLEYRTPEHISGAKSGIPVKRQAPRLR